MKTTLTVVGIVLAGLIGVAAYFHADDVGKLIASTLGATQGGTFDTAKLAAVSVNLANPGANATSSSVYNSGANARYVTGVQVGCTGLGSSKTAYTGAGLASLQLTVGTTSTAAPATIPNQAHLVASAMVIATSSADNAFASSTTATIGNGLATVWPAGSYMTFWFNATNTAACTVGVNYLSS